MASTAYYPEMNGTARTTALFAARFCHTKISIAWTADRDDEARATFRKLRIRPASIEARKAGEWSMLKGRDGFSALVTYDACEKLQNGSDVDMEILLD